MSVQSYALIGSACGWGAQFRVRETELGPDVVRQSGILEELQKNGVPCFWQSTLYPSIRIIEDPDLLPKDTLGLIVPFLHKLADEITKILNSKAMPVIIGGDHSLAIANWSSIISYHRMEQNFGLLWFDAHMDSHTPESSHSKAIHGMPLAALLGYGTQEFSQMINPHPKLNPAHVALIGVRSYEPEEEALLNRLNVRVYKMKEIRARGLKAVFHEAVERITANTKGFGISVDLDGFDPIDAPGVGTPEKNGIKKDEMLSLFKTLNNHPNLKGIEIAEFNPKRDIDNKTLNLIQSLLKSFLIGR